MHSNVTKNFQNKTSTRCPLFPGQQHFLPHIFNQCLYSIKQMAGWGRKNFTQCGTGVSLTASKGWGGGRSDIRAESKRSEEDTAAFEEPKQAPAIQSRKNWNTHTERERETFFSKSQILTGFLVGASSVGLDSFKIRQFIKVTNDLEFSDKGEKNKVRT